MFFVSLVFPEPFRPQTFDATRDYYGRGRALGGRPSKIQSSSGDYCSLLDRSTSTPSSSREQLTRLTRNQSFEATRDYYRALGGRVSSVQNSSGVYSSLPDIQASFRERLNRTICAPGSSEQTSSNDYCAIPDTQSSSGEGVPRLPLDRRGRTPGGTDSSEQDSSADYCSIPDRSPPSIPRERVPRPQPLDGQARTPGGRDNSEQSSSGDYCSLPDQQPSSRAQHQPRLRMPRGVYMNLHSKHRKRKFC